MNFFTWASADRPADVIDLNSAGTLVQLVREFGGSQPRVLDEIAGQAYDLGAQMGMIEHRYIDADYRDEHSRFYSKTFRRYPSVAVRLHFFASPPPTDLLAEDKPANFEHSDYLGYCVIRPVPGAPVGRTMLTPPSEIARFVTCTVEDKVNLLGESLKVDAAPFIAQDAQLGVCAHTTAWVTAYYHHLLYGERRFLPGEIADIVPPELGLGRPTPSTGLSIDQIVETSRRIGLPPLVYQTDALPRDETLFRIACRYLNSGLPVTVAAAGRHAFVLVGYKRVKVADGKVHIHFIRQDDESGPYRVIESPWLDEYSPWEYLVVPLPKKVFLSGERAEAFGEEQLVAALKQSVDPSAAALLDEIKSKMVTFRSTVLRSNEFKMGVRERGFPDDIIAIYQRMQMSRWIWVVEAVRHKERDKGDRSVLAEVVIDATDHLRDLQFLAVRVPGMISVRLPDLGKIIGEKLTKIPPVKTVARGDWTLQ